MVADLHIRFLYRAWIIIAISWKACEGLPNFCVNSIQWIIQFASVDDPYIPIEEAHFVHQQPRSTYYEFTNRGHFGCDRNELAFTELIKVSKNKLVDA